MRFSLRALVRSEIEQCRPRSSAAFISCVRGGCRVLREFLFRLKLYVADGLSKFCSERRSCVYGSERAHLNRLQTRGSCSSRDIGGGSQAGHRHRKRVPSPGPCFSFSFSVSIFVCLSYFPSSASSAAHLRLGSTYFTHSIERVRVIPTESGRGLTLFVEFASAFTVEVADHDHSMWLILV